MSKNVSLTNMTAWAELFLKMLQIRDSLSKSRIKGTFMQIM